MRKSGTVSVGGIMQEGKLHVRVRRSPIGLQCAWRDRSADI